MTQRTEEWAKTLRFLSSAPDEDRRTKVDKETRANVGVVDGKNNKSDSEENTGMFCIHAIYVQHSVEYFYY